MEEIFLIVCSAIQDSGICTFYENLHFFLQNLHFFSENWWFFEQMDFCCQETSQRRADTSCEISRRRRARLLDFRMPAIVGGTRKLAISRFSESALFSEICTFFRICTFLGKSALFFVKWNTAWTYLDWQPVNVCGAHNSSECENHSWPLDGLVPYMSQSWDFGERYRF